MKRTIRVFLADDQLIAREGLKGILDGVDDISIAGEAITALEVPRKVDESKPDILLMDLKWFGDESAGWSAIRDVKKQHPQVRVIAVTAYENLVRDARIAGADAVLLKTFTKDELVSLVRELAKKEYVDTPEPTNVMDDLTQRELDVVRLIADGRRDKEIAEILSISIATVKNHVKSILAKLSVSNRTQAARVARDRGFVR
jgi:two-component system, NarL family, response regulator LiaR